MKSFLKLTTPAAVVAISTANAKTHLRISHSDEDAVIDRYVAAATEYVERRTNRSLINATWTEFFSGFPAGEDEVLRLTKAPLVSVSTIKYYDSDDVQQTWHTDDYDVHSPRYLAGRVTVTPGYTWPNVRTDRPYPIQIEYLAGYGAAAVDIPQEILEAVYLVLDDFYRFRGASIPFAMSEAVAASLSRILGAQATGVYL